MDAPSPQRPPLPGTSLRLLCVDDEEFVRHSLATFLADEGHEVFTASDGNDGLETILRGDFDAVVLDLNMPGMTGLEILEIVARHKPMLPVVVVSGTGNIQDVISALRLGAWDFVTKPIEDMALLTHCLSRAVERSRLIIENQRHREHLELLVQERTLKLREEIAERRAAEDALRASLSEKEVLLKEVHHRVKNNLQIVSSLLSLQALRLSDPAMAAPLVDSQVRVRAMALVHEKLYRAKDLNRVELHEYLPQLSVFLLQALRNGPQEIIPVLECDPVGVSVDVAIPCGLIANELISNSVKHAFAGRDAGRLRIALHTQDGEVRLEVEDDGPGLPPDFRLEEVPTLGLQLVTNLARQLRGSLDVASGPGGT